MTTSTDSASADANSDVLRVFQTKEETRSFYDKIAHVYDLLSEHSEQPMREAGLKLLDVQPGERVLEIGCGTGHCLVEMAPQAGDEGHVEGIDLSEGMLKQAETVVAASDAGGRIHLTQGDAEHMPFEDDSFDAVFTSFTLELFDNPDIPLVLAEIRRVLKPGGRLCVVSISKEGSPGLVLQAFEWTHKHFPNLMDCRPIHVRKSLEQSGFQIATTRLEQMWVPVEIVLGIA